MHPIADAAAEFELTPEDWEDVNAVHLFESDLQADAVRTLRRSSGALFLALAGYTWLSGSGWAALLFLVAGVAGQALVGPTHRRAQRRALKKLTEQGIANGTFGRHRVEVREEGLFHATHAYESLFRWHAIEEVKERNGNFLVYIGPNAFVPIPATAFRDSGSLRRFADAFYARMGQRTSPPGALLEG